MRPLLKIVTVLTLATLSAGIISSCTEVKEPARSMDQIREEDGIPVTTQLIQKEDVDSKLSFFAKLQGFKEATVGAMVGGEVDEIKARVGQTVREDQVIVTFPTNLPGVQYDQARRGFENAEKTYKRMKALLEAGEVAQQQLDNVETQYEVAKRNFESVKQMLRIESPFSGVITDVYVNEGDNVSGQAALFKVAQLHKMRAELWVTGKEIAMIKAGMPAVMEWAGKRYEGKVSEVSMALDPMKQAFKVEVLFDNARRELPSGITAEINIVTNVKPESILIQRNLVKSSQNGDKYVYVVENDKALRRPVQTGEEFGLFVEVVTGLKEGEQLINCCGNLLDDGKKVRIVQK